MGRKTFTQSKDDGRLLVGVSAFGFLRCLETYGWVTGRVCVHKKSLCHLSSKVLFLNRC